MEDDDRQRLHHEVMREEEYRDAMFELCEKLRVMNGCLSDINRLLDSILSDSIRIPA